MYIIQKCKLGEHPIYAILDFNSQEDAENFQYNDGVGNSLTIVASITWEQKRKILRATARLNKEMPLGMVWIMADVKQLKKNVKVGFTLKDNKIGKYKVYISI